MVHPSLTKIVAASESQVQADIHEIDALFRHAGLTRGRRGTAVRVKRPAKLDRAAPEELRRAAGVAAVAPNSVHWFPVPGWERFPWLWHGFSTRKGGLSRAYCAEDAKGELNLGFTPEDARETVVANRRLLAEAVTGSAETPLAALRQFHSHLVIRTHENRDGSREAVAASSCKADGHLTDEPGVLLGIQTADCIPVLVADKRRRVVGAFHAGWRGTVGRIVETGVGRMRLEFGSRAEDLVAAIGPGVGTCCYAVGEEVYSEFESQFQYARELFHEVYSSDVVRTKYPMLFLTQRAPGHSPIGPSLHLDLVEANRRQLLDAGVKPRAIKIVPGCTSCEAELFFSHRASKGYAGRMMAVIGVRGR